MTTLEVLLAQLRDGSGDAAVLARARALVAGDERLPPDVREIALQDPAEAAEDAVGLLAVLGVDDLGQHLADAIQAELADEPLIAVDDGWAPIGDALREGILAEAGFSAGEAPFEAELAGLVLRRLPLSDFAWGPVLADAVQREAGPLDVAEAVLARVEAGFAQSAPLAQAVLAEAGDVDLANAVLAALGVAVLPVRDAVLAEAGSVQLADWVMERTAGVDAMSAARHQVAPTVVAPAGLPLGSIRIPSPANNVRRFGWMAMAAAVAMISVVTGRLALPTGDAVPSLVFAQAGDVVIEDLSTGDDVSVVQLEGDDGAVILWIDEEA